MNKIAGRRGEGKYPLVNCWLQERAVSPLQAVKRRNTETYESTWRVRLHTMGLGVGWCAPSVCLCNEATAERGRGDSCGGNNTLYQREVTRSLARTTDAGSKAASEDEVFKQHWNQLLHHSLSNNVHLFRMGEGRNCWGGDEVGAYRGCDRRSSDTPINRVTAGGVGARNRQDWEVVPCNRDDLTRLTSDNNNRESTESASGVARAARSNDGATGGTRPGFRKGAQVSGHLSGGLKYGGVERNGLGI